MEMTVKAPMDGKVKRVLLKANDTCEGGDLIIELEWKIWNNKNN